MIHLLIQRHAKTEPFSESGKDFDRKLLKKGINQAIELGKFYHENKIDSSQIYCSTAARTRQTALYIQNHHAFSSKIQFIDALYLCDKQDLLSFIWAQDHGEDVLILGHNDGISDLASYFTDDYIELKTGEFLQIDFDFDSWKEISKGLGKISKRYRPDI